MAEWSLKEFFPKFLTAHPQHAVHALVDALDGFIAHNHGARSGARTWQLIVEGASVRLVEDWSYIWAWNPDESHLGPVIDMVKTFIVRLRKGEPAIATILLDEAIRCNPFGILWARLFMVGAQRADLGARLWPYATTEAFLLCSDTRKDAIDLIAAQYPNQSKNAKEQFEAAALAFDFTGYEDTERARRSVLETIFGTLAKRGSSFLRAKTWFLQRARGTRS
jgi:hypothetical protein